MERVPNTIITPDKTLHLINLLNNYANLIKVTVIFIKLILYKKL
jgi:hypothetical protein